MHSMVDAGVNEDVNLTIKRMKKSVMFASAEKEQDVRSGDSERPRKERRESKKSILKPITDTKDTEELDTKEKKVGTESSKVKKNKNTLKRIKWVKRHKKKTQTKKQRQENKVKAATLVPKEVGERVMEALDYLYDWYTNPETWKFKKLSQATLIKYAFDEQLIDRDTYDLLVHYLAGIKGATSERLADICKQLIDSKGDLPLDETDAKPPLLISIPKSSSVVVDRAKQLLAILTNPTE